MPLEHTLYGFLIWMEQEYESSSTAKFIDQQLIRQLQNARHREPFGHMEPVDVALSFKTLLNGVLVELLHSGSTIYYQRLNAAWPIFWRGITLIPPREA